MKRFLLTITALSLLGGGGWGAWALWMAPQEDPKVAEIRAQFTELAQKKDDELSDEERRDAWREARKQMEELSPEQRKTLWEAPGGLGDVMQARFDREMQEFFALPAEERTAALDKQIDRMERFRKAAEERRAEREAQGGGSGGSERGGSRASDQGATNGGPPGGGPPGGGFRGDFGKMSPEDANKMRARRLDRSTPEQRAMRTEFFRLLNERRKERGLPEMRGPGR